MKKMLKKAICVFGATMYVLGAATIVSADTVTFNVTAPGDPYSYAVRKADTEQRFYVTGTGFSNSGSLMCTSGLAGEDHSSHTATISSGHRAASAGYRAYAYPNYEYEMHSRSSVAGLNVTGRYTP